MIEVLVALAIVTALLSSIAGVIASSVRGTRQISQRLALAATAETMLASLPTRQGLKAGRQSGEVAGHRWQIDIRPLAISTDEAARLRWVPVGISLQIKAQTGQFLQVDTVRLVQTGVE